MIVLMGDKGGKEVVKSFKENMDSLEKRIGDDNNADSTKDFTIALTWLDYLQRPDTALEEVSFLLREWLPKTIRCALNRKYDWNRVDFEAVMGFLEGVVETVAKTLDQSNIELCAALRDLLDPTHSFYAKYCSLKNSAGAADDMPPLLENGGGTFGAEMEWLSTGEFIDCRNKFGVWQIVSIAQFSDFRTEIKVTWPNEESEWLSLERDINRLAKFGSRSTEGPVIDLTGDSSPRNFGSQGTGPGTGTGGVIDFSADVTDVTDVTWKQKLTAGDLVDAQVNNVWYQACIMEIKMEVGAGVGAGTGVGGGAGAGAGTGVGGDVGDDAQALAFLCDSSLDEMYGFPEPAMAVDAGTVVATAGAGAGTGASTGVGADVGAVAGVAGTGANAGADADTAALGVGAPIPDTHTRTLARVAFIGLPEAQDEWIDLFSTAGDRVQQINSCSFGRRGKTIAVRQEILHIVNLGPVTQSGSGTESGSGSGAGAGGGAETSSKFVYACYREGCFQPLSFVRLANAFGQGGGFDRLLNLLRVVVGEGWGDGGGSGGGGGGGGSQGSVGSGSGGGGGIDTFTSLLGLLHLCALVGPMHRILSPQYLAPWGPLYLHLTSHTLRLMSFSLAHIRETPLEALEPVLTALELISISLYGRTRQAGATEPLKLHLALESLQCPFLNRRLGGLKMLADMVRRGENASECPGGLRVTRTTNNSNNGTNGANGAAESVSYQVLPVLYHFSLGELCGQLSACEALRQIFVGPTAHESLISRAGPVLRALASQCLLPQSLLEAIWHAGVGENRPSALVCLQDVLASLPPEEGVRVLTLVRALPEGTVTPAVVGVVAALAVRCRQLLLCVEGGDEGEIRGMGDELARALAVRAEG
ncbi:hypothetical protein B484DRAFT_422241, partial [Ochromonadaceae sp. CCMP2298]